MKNDQENALATCKVFVLVSPDHAVVDDTSDVHAQLHDAVCRLGDNSCPNSSRSGSTFVRSQSMGISLILQVHSDESEYASMNMQQHPT